MRLTRLSLLVCILPFIPAAAQAQTFNLTGTEPSRGVTLPPTSAALVDQGTATALNPAGLAAMDGSELFLLFDRNLASGQTSNALYFASNLGGLAGGIGVDWIRSGATPGYRRTSWGLAMGSSGLALGATYHFFSSDDDPAYNALGGLDLGLLARPSPALSVGAVVKNLDQQSRFGLAFERQYDLGFGIRPLGKRYTLAADYLASEARGLLAGRLTYTLQAELFNGMQLGAGVSHGLRPGDDVLLQVSFTLNADYLGITYAGGSAPGGYDHVVAVRASSQRYPSFHVAPSKLVLVDLQDRLSEGSGMLSLLGIGDSDTYLKLTQFLEQLGRDPEVTGVVLKIDSLPDVGLGKIEELRRQVMRLRDSGKKVIAVLLSARDQDYLLATAADRIYATPQATLLINGFSASAMYLGGSMEKLGVHWDVARVGAYKNAPDQLTRTDMSAEQRESINAYLDTDVRYYEAVMQQARKIAPDKLKAILAEGLISPRRAKELGLVDDLLAAGQLGEELEEALPGTSFDEHYDPRDRRDMRWSLRRRIAIIPVLGSIAGGKSRNTPLGQEAVAGAETIVRALDRASDDPSIAAIVLRVDSPGGEGGASDLIYRAVLEAKKKKPVVASMGDVAASGGYYVSMGADEILASPTTLTGSIGVFILKPALEGLLAKLSANQETIKRAPLSDLLGSYSRWTPEERAAAQRWVDAFYDDFITEVASSRRLPKEKVDSIARGRVWSGEDAKARGLVDGYGGLLDAITHARRRAQVPENEDLDITVLGEAHAFLSSLGGEDGVLARAAEKLLPRPELPSGLSTLARQLGIDPLMLSTPGVQARMPFTLRVE